MKIERIKAYKSCLLFILAAIYIKVLFFLPMFRANLEVELRVSDLFPGALSSTSFLIIIYSLPVLTCICFISKKKIAYLYSAILLILCSLILLLHIGTYNDATFTTSLWASIWLLLLTLSPMDDAKQKLQLIGIGQLIIAMTFLGGFIGKLTPEYWSGEVLFNAYFMYKNNLPYPLIRSLCDTETIRVIAKYFSAMVILTELFMALSFFLPVRKFVPIGIIICSGIVLFSHIYLFSVMGPLIGIIVSIHFLNKDSDETLKDKALSQNLPSL